MRIILNITISLLSDILTSSGLSSDRRMSESCWRKSIRCLDLRRRLCWWMMMLIWTSISLFIRMGCWLWGCEVLMIWLSISTLSQKSCLIYVQSERTLIEIEKCQGRRNMELHICNKRAFFVKSDVRMATFIKWGLGFKQVWLRLMNLLRKILRFCSKILKS